MPRDSRVVALIRAVYKDLHGKVDKPTRELEYPMREASLKEGMRGLHDLIRQKPSPLFTLLGWSSVSVTFLIIQFIYLGLLVTILPLWS